MREELLPCPFCGGAPEGEPWHGGPRTKRRVGCNSEECPAAPAVTGDTERQAITRWNQRSVNAALDAIAVIAEIQEGRGT